MRSYGTAFTLLSLGLILGCTQTPAPTAVLAAPRTDTQVADLHRFEVNGTLVVDSETGKVWKYDGTVLVPVAYKGDTPQVIEQWVRDPNTKKLVCVNCKP